MFVLIAYDVQADRCNKYHSLLSKYLLHKQKVNHFQVEE